MALAIGNLLGPVTVLAMIVGAAVGILVVASLVAHFRERAATHRPVAAGPSGQPSSSFTERSKLSA